MWMLYNSDADVYGQAASNLVSGNNLEQTIQQILDMGGGTWERDTVVRALRAAYNNPERAIDYLYSVSSMLTNYLPMHNFHTLLKKDYFMLYSPQTENCACDGIMLLLKGKICIIHLSFSFYHYWCKGLHTDPY